VTLTVRLSLVIWLQLLAAEVALKWDSCIATTRLQWDFSVWCTWDSGDRLQGDIIILRRCIFAASAGCIRLAVYDFLSMFRSRWNHSQVISHKVSWIIIHENKKTKNVLGCQRSYGFYIMHPIMCRVRIIHKKLDRTDSVILCHRDWLSQYLVQYWLMAMKHAVFPAADGGISC